MRRFPPSGAVFRRVCGLAAPASRAMSARAPARRYGNGPSFCLYLFIHILHTFHHFLTLLSLNPPPLQTPSPPHPARTDPLSTPVRKVDLISRYFPFLFTFSSFFPLHKGRKGKPSRPRRTGSGTAACVPSRTAQKPSNAASATSGRAHPPGRSDQIPILELVDLKCVGLSVVFFNG